MQNSCSKSETAIILAGCLNVRRFQFFSPFQFPHFRLLIFFRPFVGFFRRFVGFFNCSYNNNYITYIHNPVRYGLSLALTHDFSLFGLFKVAGRNWNENHLTVLDCMIYNIYTYIYMIIYVNINNYQYIICTDLTLPELGREWENGMIVILIMDYYRSFPHSLLSTRK